MRITVSHDLSRIAQSLNRLSGRLNGSLEEPLRAIGGILESSTRRRIAETKTAPDGKRWQDVSPATAEAKNGAAEFWWTTATSWQALRTRHRQKA